MNDSNAHRPSKKQRELLTFIEAFITAHGYGPSYREIMRALNYKSVSTVAVHVDNLIKKGHLHKRDKSARSLEVVQGGGAGGKAAATLPVKHITRAEEKWLVDQVAAKFAAAQEDAKTPAELDGLYVLVGALHILGFGDAARAYQGQLQEIHRQMAK